MEPIRRTCLAVAVLMIGCLSQAYAEEGKKGLVFDPDTGQIYAPVTAPQQLYSQPQAQAQAPAPAPAPVYTPAPVQTYAVPTYAPTYVAPQPYVAPQQYIAPQPYVGPQQYVAPQTYVAQQPYAPAPPTVYVVNQAPREEPRVSAAARQTGSEVSSSEPSSIIRRSGVFEPVIQRRIAASEALAEQQRHRDVEFSTASHRVFRNTVDSNYVSASAAHDCGCPDACCDTCCPDACCDSCCDPCCDPPLFPFVGGAEATFFGITGLDGSNVSTSITDLTTATTRSFGGDLADVGNDFTFAPRVWLGVQGLRWGLIGRFWYLSESSDAFQPWGLGLANAGIDANSQIEAYTADMEVRRLFLFDQSSFWASFGARYASLGQSARVTSTALLPFGGATLARATASTTRQFDGTGITFGGGGRHALWYNSPFHFIWGGRGSVVWGDGFAGADTATAIAAPAALQVGAGTAGIDGSGDLWIWEALLGIQWQRALRAVPANAFCRFAVEYQHWETNDNIGAAAFSISNPGVGARASAFATSTETDLDLLGFTLGAGLTY